ncbi:unnamed protein product, partial [Rotaria sordida]
MIFYILFLGLFSFVLLVDYFPLNIYNEYQSEIQILPISITEIILHICFWSFIIEEIRQVIESGLWTCQLLHDVTNFGFWKIFGQVDPIDGTNAYSIVTFILTILFVTISNVLVALFNIIIENVQMQSHRIWRYQP